MFETLDSVFHQVLIEKGICADYPHIVTNHDHKTINTDVNFNRLHAIIMSERVFCIIIQRLKTNNEWYGCFESVAPKYRKLAHQDMWNMIIISLLINSHN